MRIFLIAGEASGDLHGGYLARALKAKNPNVQLMGWGGDAMIANGVEVYKHINDLAIMGFVEVIKNVVTISKNINSCKQTIDLIRPHAIVLIDYPGFNLRIAKFAKSLNIKVFYYIAPKVWAWKTSRVRHLRNYTDHLFLIFPFEQEFFAKHQVRHTYVGNPSAEEFADAQSKMPEIVRNKAILLMPGSRRQEVYAMLPTMLAATQKFSNYSIKLLLAPSISERMIAPLVNNHNVELLRGEPFAHMLKMQAGIVKSGTSTLEAAIAFMPQVVVYKGNALSIWIAKKLVGGKIKFISLVNLVMNKMVVKELIQEQASAAAIEKELSQILDNEQYRLKMLADYQGLKNILGKGKASVNVANIIMDELDEVQLDI